MSSPSYQQRALIPAVHAAGLCKTIDGRPVLSGIDLAIAPGEFVTVLGKNGAGKSTLLKVLSTLAPLSAGKVHLFGFDTSRQPALARASVGLIGHQSMLYGDLSARENLLLFGRLYGISQPARRADHLLDAVGLFDRAHDPVKTFSRGMAQRLSIARALVHEPALLLADEPFAGLDLNGAAAIERLLSDLNAAGKTIVMVNHDVLQSLRLAERVILIEHAHLALDQAARMSDAPEIVALLAGSDPGFQFREIVIR